MTRTIRVDQDAPDCEALLAAQAVLEESGVLVLPTDSVYGIGCAAVPGNPALGRIFEIKRRERSQTLPWLLADACDLATFGCRVPDWAHRLADALWPGALTLVVAASENVGVEYMASDATIALRVPASTLVRELARRVGPLACTSANTHGEAAATSGAAVEGRIAQAVDLLLDAGPAPLAIPSTIVCATTEQPRILREGAISARTVLRVCGG